MSCERLSGVVHIVEPQAEIAHADAAFGNVDTRAQFGDPELSFQARQEFLAHTLRPKHYVLQAVKMRPEFTDLSGIATENLASRYETDGLFIDRPEVAVGLNPADCNAITMFDAAQGRALGMIHAGRQGVAGDIHLKALEHLTGVHAVPLEDVRIHFAPSVRADSYFFKSVSAEQLADPKWSGLIAQREGNYHIDLLGRIVRDLLEAGVQEDQMVISPEDTGANPAYFSHARSQRTGEQCGRNAIAAVLRAQELTDV